MLTCASSLTMKACSRYVCCLLSLMAIRLVHHQPRTSAFPELEPTADSITAGKLRRLIKPYRKDELAVALREVLAAASAAPRP